MCLTGFSIKLTPVWKHDIYEDFCQKTELLLLKNQTEFCFFYHSTDSPTLPTASLSRVVILKLSLLRPAVLLQIKKKQKQPTLFLLEVHLKESTLKFAVCGSHFFSSLQRRKETTKPLKGATAIPVLLLLLFNSPAQEVARLEVFTLEVERPLPVIPDTVFCLGTISRHFPGLSEPLPAERWAWGIRLVRRVTLDVRFHLMVSRDAPLCWAKLCPKLLSSSLLFF